jgi:hypothetical protein
MAGQRHPHEVGGSGQLRRIIDRAPACLHGGVLVVSLGMAAGPVVVIPGSRRHGALVNGLPVTIQT